MSYMQDGCIVRIAMPKAIQIRDVPDDVHAQLRSHAAAAGMSLSDYLLDELTEIARRPTVAEVLARARARHGGASPQAVVRIIRELRGPLPGE